MPHLFNRKITAAVVFILIVILCFTPFFSPSIALCSGIALSLTLGHPFLIYNRRAINILLQLSIIGLGFGINIYEAANAGKEGLAITAVTIVATIGIGLIVGKLLKLTGNVTLLISVGTAICGGSAIAAIAPIVDANEEEMTVALGTVFILNAFALLLFPFIGNQLAMTQQQFGIWSAIAIHDTSSVIGAAQAYGSTALQIATTVKLERALWIVPISLFIATLFKKSNSIKFPYFILLFIAAIALSSLVTEVQGLAQWIVPISKKGMTLTLFLIGAGLSTSSVKRVGFKPFMLGVGLWITIAIGSLVFIMKA